VYVLRIQCGLNGGVGSRKKWLLGENKEKEKEEEDV
jgi:hypothetical protein